MTNLALPFLKNVLEHIQESKIYNKKPA